MVSKLVLCCHHAFRRHAAISATQEAEQVLEEAHRERSRLDKHRSHLESELSRLSAELGMDLKLTPIEVTLWSSDALI